MAEDSTVAANVDKLSISEIFSRSESRKTEKPRKLTFMWRGHGQCMENKTLSSSRKGILAKKVKFLQGFRGKELGRVGRPRDGWGNESTESYSNVLAYAVVHSARQEFLFYTNLYTYHQITVRN